MNKKAILIVLLIASINIVAKGQDIAIKTNALYWGINGTINLGMEIGLDDNSTLDIGAGYNPWKVNGSGENNKKLAHWLGQVEYRYWFCRKFIGNFVGVHMLGGQYNISNYNLRMLFGKDSKDYRFQGYAIGGGISWGYQFYLGKHWNLETTIGVGYARLQYSKYNCKKCGVKLETKGRNYFGPTKAGVSIVYLIK